MPDAFDETNQYTGTPVTQEAANRVPAATTDPKNFLTPFKSLETEDGRREYYTYDRERPETLRHHAEPYLDPAFNEQLIEMFGRDPHGDPRMRIVWAGTLRAPMCVDLGDRLVWFDGMKYPYMRTKRQIAWEYIDRNGKRVTTTNDKSIPQGTVYGPVYEWDALGHMKFVIEMKFTAEELVKLRKYPKPGSDEEKNWGVKNGKRYLRPPNPDGEYQFVHYVEDGVGGYADCTQAHIDKIKEIFDRSLSETEEEFVARKLAEREALAIAEQAAADLNFSNHVHDARVRAEKKAAKGKILYGHR